MERVAKMRFAAVRVLTCFVLVGLAGCGGGDGPERVVVTGKVTFQGQPLANGEIRFVPTKGTEAPVSGASIAEGAYRADGLGGVPVGTHKVVIQGFRAADTPVHDPIEGDYYPREQYLPTKYNDQTELEITVQPGSGTVTKDYELTE